MASIICFSLSAKRSDTSTATDSMEISVNTLNVTVASVLFVSSYLYSNYILRLKTIYTLQHESKKYTGSCHCNKVIFDVIGPKHLVAWDCNCSICYMKKNWHFIVPRSNFTLISGLLLFSYCFWLLLYHVKKLSTEETVYNNTIYTYIQYVIVTYSS